MDMTTNRAAAGAIIKLIGADSSKTIVRADSSGYYLIDSNHFYSSIDYLISAEVVHNTYLSREELSISQASTKRIDTITENFVLTNYLFFMGEERWPTILFSENSYELTQSMKNTALTELYSLFVKYSKMLVEIDGHADDPGGFKHNLYLSKMRAQVCKDYLVSRGIDSNRIVVKGWGNKKPWHKPAEIKRMETKTERDSAHEENRRIVYQILSY